MIDTTESPWCRRPGDLPRAGGAQLHQSGEPGRADRPLGALMKAHGARAIALCIDERGRPPPPGSWRRAEDPRHRLRGVRPLPGQPDLRRPDPAHHHRAGGAAERRGDPGGDQADQGRAPGVFTILGVSNLSFGIAPHARAVLNSVFLYHAVKAGLDLAIINPAHTRPYAEIPPEQREVAEPDLQPRAAGPGPLHRLLRGVAPEAEAGDAPRRRSGSCPGRPHPLPHPAPQGGVESLIDAALAQRMADGAGRHDARWTSSTASCSRR